MTNSETAIELQRQTLRLYGELVAREEDFAGKLVFSSAKNAVASGLPAAVSVAGGCSLIVEADAAAVKAVLRLGGVDFVVNTLDEALRVLKNEIRKHKPLSVALTAEPVGVLVEMTERGVRPDLWIEDVAAESLLSSWLAERGWKEVVVEASSAAELRVLENRLVEIFGAEDAVRRRWVQRIAQFQRTGNVRLVWLSESEAGSLNPA